MITITATQIALAIVAAPVLLWATAVVAASWFDAK
jgi:hypothetical protein